MAIELKSNEISPCRIIYGDSQPIALAAGQGIRIQTGTAQEPVNHLAQQVPAGKQWSVYVYVKITETDI